jgi:thiol-disulfide isomerase/thioredoxin
VIVAALGVASPAHAGQATCSNPGPPAGATASSELMPGRLVASLTTSLLPIRSVEELGGTQLLTYEARVLLSETRVSAEYALRPWLAIGAALPYRRVGIGVTYRDQAGAEVEPESTIHARDEVVHGIGDASLLVHAAREVGGVTVHARAGTSLPIGHTEPDPFALGADGLEHQHVQLGTGTLIPMVAVEAQRRFGASTVAAWALAQPSLYPNRHGYRAGHRASTGLTALSALGLRGLTFSAAAELHLEGAERWDGEVPEDEGNQGRRDLLIGAAVAWRPRRDLAITADLKVPAWSEAVGSQLDYALVATVGVTGSFDVGRPPSYRGVDHEELGPAGAAAALDPVPGKVTVFDLWADWCAPCRELDDALAALARRHADRIAVRRLDVVDDESAAWRAYLEDGGYALPHVKVYDEGGRLVLERTAPVEELIREIEAIVAE